jgi:methyltransferase (TIGR00027 family)
MDPRLHDGTPLIRNVSDTALWVAYYRAMETGRPDAHFRDPFARALAGERGKAIVDAMPNGRSMAWPMVVRTCVMDELILRLVREGGADALVNLAAGLDARPWRMPLPATFAWYDVDLPDILGYKRDVIAGAKPVCAYAERAADLADAGARRSMLAEVASAHRRVVVLSEGLLVYLEPGQVSGLAADLAVHEAFRWWITDLGSPRLLKMLAKTWAARLGASGAPMRFAPAEGTRFFEAHGWRESEFRSIWEESLRLKRSVPFAGLWAWLGRLAPRERREEMRRMSGVVRLERAGGAGGAGGAGSAASGTSPAA